MKRLTLFLGIAIAIFTSAQIVHATQVINDTLQVSSLRVGQQGVGGVTFFNGTIINNTTTNGVDNPVTFGDNIRIDGKVYRGSTSGPGDNKPFTVNDDLLIQGNLTVSGTSPYMSSISCDNGQILKYGQNRWTCGTDADTDTLSSLDCEAYESPRFTGTDWECTRLIRYDGDSRISGTLGFNIPSNKSAIMLGTYNAEENYIQLDDTEHPYSPPSGSCSSYEHMGRMLFDPYANKLWICAVTGWKSFTSD